LENLVKSCLVKDPEERMQNATDLKHALHWINDSAPAQSSTTKSRGSLLPWVLFASAVIGSLAFFLLRPSQSSGSSRLPFAAPANYSITNIAVSPDGQTVVFPSGNGTVRKLFLRHTNAFETIELKGTETAESPFFSPDGKWIAFFAAE